MKLVENREKLLDETKTKFIILLLFVVVFAFLMFFAPFGGIKYSADDALVLFLSSFSSLIFALYSTIIVGTNTEGKKVAQSIPILIGVVLGLVFAIVGFLLYSSFLNADEITKSWYPIFFFYASELWGVSLGPLID